MMLYTKRDCACAVSNNRLNYPYRTKPYTHGLYFNWNSFLRLIVVVIQME